eukprot:EG_transcript_8565
MPRLMGGAAGFVDGPAEQARVRFPALMAVDDGGNLFLADTGNGRIRKLGLDGLVSTVAGSGLPGWLDGPASEARFSFPAGISLDPRCSGGLLVTDYMAHCIRVINPDGIVFTIAGVPGESGHRDGPAQRALFTHPTFVEMGPSGDLFVMDRGNHCIRRIDMKTLLVSTFAGNGRPGFQDGTGAKAQFSLPMQCATDVDGTMWVAENNNHAIRRVAPDGSVVTVAGNGTPGYADGQGAEARFKRPMSIVLDGNGNLVVADIDNDCIRLVTPAGFVSTLLAPGLCPCKQPTSITLTHCSELVIGDFRHHTVYIVPIGLPPHQRCPIRRALARHLSDRDRVQALLWPNHAPLTIGDQLEAVPGTTLVDSAHTNTNLPELHAFLLFTYTSEIRGPENIIGLMYLCQQYGRPDGVQQCLQYCRRHVRPTNAIQWLVESHRRGVAELTHWLMQYVRQNWDSIRLTAPRTFNLLQPHPKLLESTIPDRMRLK